MQWGVFILQDACKICISHAINILQIIMHIFIINLLTRSAARTSAPDLIKTSTTAICPCLAAACRGVHLFYEVWKIVTVII